MDKAKQQELLDLVKENYNEIAGEFDLTRKKKLWPELDKITSLIPDGSIVLDAGCGNGRLLEAFKEKEIDYLGFDNSSELINLAKKNYPDANFIVDDILEMNNISDKYFDFIFSIAVIPHIPSEELRIKAINLLADKLKHSGEAILSFWDLRSQKKYKKLLITSFIKSLFGLNRMDKGDLLFPWRKESGSVRYYHAFSLKELESLVKKTNLEIKDLYRADNNIWLILKHSDGK